MQLRLEQTRPIYPPNVHDLNTKTQGQLVLIELGYGYNYAPGRVCTSTRGMSLACLRTYRRLGGEKILRLVRDVFGCVCSCVFFFTYLCYELFMSLYAIARFHYSRKTWSPFTTRGVAMEDGSS